MSKGRILIAGAGVAGLLAALELAARGWNVRLVEKAETLSEVGAGLQLAPNAMRHLQRLGVADRLSTRAVTPEALYLMDGRKVRPLMEMKLGDKARQRWHHPYAVCHRADLQSALLDACREQPGIEISLGAEITDHHVENGAVVATVRHGNSEEPADAAYLIACDGVWSVERSKAGFSKARFSGHIAWRTTLAASALPASFLNATPERKAVSAWLGNKAHFIAYPVKGGSFFNFVAITTGENPGEVWSRTGDPARLRSIYADWGAPVRDVLAAADEWTYWPLFEMPDAQFVGPDRTIFLGDASHAVTPFAAQGAAMAIEDAAALAQALDGSDRESGLRRFDAVRKERIAAVAKRGQLNRFAYHATGIFALGRNTLFALRSPDSFLKDLDWLYGYDAIAAMQDQGRS
ncbi:salicylate hydroxylase [Ochrobactrum sp. 695/2009]|nr:salicylate hydroxylase [Ochrobactrum sp. 721/2009]PJT16666.1 salicylate hydroxylase [Ochrobactrum sp. 720/2009]PJT26488.1 salicylate hydroxylase [Ochrobactrum sp. 715/2009]PJT26822.1 salicylate hydroxylase [Ochrobactrum sp. 695/2009]PJT36008.1 salicylate hydroxylase [Ochrobactrum sp. 689/2009]